MKFLPEVESIRKEAKRLKAAGVDILIALGHSGYIKDKAIAAGVADIDLVVGGHSHSFLYTGGPPSVEKPEGPYPTLVKQPGTGRVVPVVQAYAYTKYMGLFRMQFDDNGEATSWEGLPKLLDSKTKQGENGSVHTYLGEVKLHFNLIPDEFVLNELVPWKNEVDSFGKYVD